MKNQSVITIYNDGSLAICANGLPKLNEKNFKSVKSFLVPLLAESSIQSFIPVPVTKLTTASRVKIDIEMQMCYISDGTPSYTIGLEPKEIDTDNIVEIYNFLFSFLRYEMLNSLEEVYADDLIPMQAFIEPYRFSMQVFKEDKCIYDVYISPDDPVTTKYGKIDTIIEKFFKFGKHPLMGKINKEKVYRIANSHIEIIPISMIKESDLIGIASPYTRTITFIEARKFIMLKHSIKYACINFLHVDRNSLTSADISDALEYSDSIGIDIIPLKSMNYWAHDIYTLIGFVDHLSYYSQLLDVMIKMLYRKEFPELSESMDIETVVLVEVEFLSIRTRRTIRKYSLREIPALDKFIDDMVGYAPYL